MLQPLSTSDIVSISSGSVSSFDHVYVFLYIILSSRLSINGRVLYMVSQCKQTKTKTSIFETTCMAQNSEYNIKCRKAWASNFDFTIHLYQNQSNHSDFWYFVKFSVSTGATTIINFR